MDDTGGGGGGGAGKGGGSLEVAGGVKKALNGVSEDGVK